ncbi:MAG: SNF2 helicase-associated domain-containing protein, partial [Elusimicrobia bacterium]|nr:SNF2 helicase-associated domain-containing protein [Elusimicrobiota bacterium]
MLREAPEPTRIGPITLSAWRVRGLILRPDQIVSWLISLPGQEDLQSRGLVLADNLRFWQAAAHWALRILLEEQFLPGVSQWNENGSKEAGWEPLLDAPGISEAVQHLVESMPPVCLSFSYEPPIRKTGVTAQELLHGFLRSTVDAEVRLSLTEVRGSLPKPSTLQDVWLKMLTEERSDPRLPKEAVNPLEEALASWRRRLQAASDDGLRICLRLHPPAGDSKRWRLEYLLQATSDPSLLVKAEQLWGNSTASRRLAALCKVNPEERLLAALGLAGRIFPPIEKSLKGPRPSVVFLDVVHAHRFLKESSPVLASSGFGIFLPPWWKAQDSPRLGIQLSLRPKRSSESFGLDTGLQLNWAVALGQETLTVQELEALAEMKVPLVQVRGQWVEADPEALKKALDFWRRHEGQDLTLGGVFGLIRQQSALGLGPIGVSDLKGEGWIG